MPSNSETSVAAVPVMPASLGKFLKKAWYETLASVMDSFWMSSPSLASTACAAARPGVPGVARGV